MRAAQVKGRIAFLRLPAWLGLLLLLPVIALAEQLPIKRYTTSDGLANDRVKRIFRDSRGFLWFCTADGLSRFDGYRFVRYSAEQGLPHPNVSDIVEEGDGVYWAATYGGGLCRLDFSPETLRQNGQAKLTVYPVSHDPGANGVNALLKDRAGRIWIGVDDGLFLLSDEGGKKEIRRVDLGPMRQPVNWLEVGALLESRDGSIWIGASMGIARRLPDGRIVYYKTPSLRWVRSLIEDADGRIWIGHAGGVVVFKPEPIASLAAAAPFAEIAPAKSRTVPALPNGNPELPVSDGEAVWHSYAPTIRQSPTVSLHQTGDGRVWIGTYGGGLIAAHQGQLRHYTIAHGLSDNTIFTMADDLAGNHWIGTLSGGAMKIAKNGFTTYKEADGLGHTRVVNIFETPAGELTVIGSDWNISQFDGRGFKSVRANLPTEVTGVASHRNRLIIQDRAGEWWMPSGQGLFRFPRVDRLELLAAARPIAVYTARDGLVNSNPNLLLADSRGDIWIAINANDGLMRWERKTDRIHRFTTAADGTPHSFPTALAEDKSGAVWIGYRNGALARYRAGRFQPLTADDCVPAGTIQNLFVDSRGGLWIASDRSGAARIDDPDAQEPFFTYCTTTQGLSGNTVWCFTEDLSGRIYIGTGRGVDRLDPDTGHIRHYTTSDGLSSNEVRVAFRDRRGMLWFGSPAGLSRLAPEAESAAPSPQSLISQIQIAGVRQAISDLGAQRIELGELDPDQNNLGIEFFGLSFGAGEMLRYRFKLEGADQNWRSPTDQRRVDYANLSPGRYRFLVQTLNADEVVAESPATVTFTILPPLWKRWWFIALAGSILAAALLAFERYRVLRLIELERVRMRIATDLHDDIGAGLSRIAILSEVAHGRLSTGDLRGRDHMTTIAQGSRELLDSMSDIVWAINPQKEQLKDLVQRMRRFASDVLGGRNVAFHFRAPEAEADHKLGADIRREVFLIFKESVNNLARHSGASQAEIDLRVDRNWLTLQVRDDGRGFDAAIGNGGEGNGLASMRNRAGRLGGDLQIVSTPGQGTTINLRAPLRQRNWLETAKVEDPRRRNGNQSIKPKSRLFSFLARLNRR